MTAEPCTSHARRKKHYSTNLRPYPIARAGRIGTTLCGIDAVDQQRVDYWRTAKRRRTDIHALPECKLCVRRMR